MFNAFQNPAPPSDAEIAGQALNEESTYRFQAFSANDAVTLGLSIRKRFRASSRHAKGKGLVIAIETVAGHTLFSCTVGDLGHPSGVADVGLSSWTCLQVRDVAAALGTAMVDAHCDCALGNDCSGETNRAFKLLCRESNSSRE